jgi:NADH:ubiquinone oxidoreductase subunit 5 (subunit L)/multisubunit Na+/H+ antiporter MnhA subunit
MTADAALVALVALPAAVGAVLCLLATLRSPVQRRDLGGRPPRAAVAASLTTATAVLALAVVVAVQRPGVGVTYLAGTSLQLDVGGLAALFAPTVAAITLLVLVFAAADLDSDPAAAGGSPARFHGLMLLFASAALLTVVAGTLPTLLLAWEVMGATSYALIGFRWRDPHRVSSGLVAFVTTRTADLGLYVAVGAALAGGAGMALADLDQASSGWRDVIAAGVAVAALGKAAQLPFSFWLSRAMDGPSPVSALLHSAAMVALGGYLLLRVEPLLAATGWAADAVAWVGAATAVLLGAVAVAQRDLKQLLAASTAAQLGFVVLAAGVGSVAGGAAHLVGHAAVKSLLFLVAGAWLAALGTKDLGRLTGAARRWPLVGAVATAGLLSLAGVVPLALWATKDEVLAAALDRSPALYVTGLAGAALAACYAGKALAMLLAPRPVDEPDGPDALPRWTQLPLVPLALGAVSLEVLALPPVGDHVRRLVGDTTSATATVAEMVVSAVVAVAALVATLVLVRRSWRPRVPTGALERWLDLEAAAGRVIVGPTLGLARAVAATDDRVLDRAVWLVAAGCLRAGRAVRALDGRGVDGAVGAIAGGVRRSGNAVPATQSGQLHHYYLQAMAVLDVVVIVLVTVSLSVR